MILQQLYADAESILGETLPPPMYDLKPVRWVIVLKPDGTLVNIESLGGGKEDKKGIDHLVPMEPPRSGNLPVPKPNLLMDTPIYVLGIGLEEKRPSEKHAAFKELVSECEISTGNLAVTAVSRFLSMWNSDATQVPKEMQEGDRVTFRVGQDWPVDQEAVQRFWAAKRGEDIGAEGQCLVSGFFGPTERILQQKITGIPGGTGSGTTLVSADKEAFWSYNLTKAQVSPISREAAERFMKALNRLIRDERTHLTLRWRSGDTDNGLVYVFWTRQGADPGFLSFVDRPDSAQVRELLYAYRSGRRHYTRIDDEDFFAFAVSAAAGRTVIRDWLRTTVRDTRENLARWFEAHRVTAPDGGEGHPFGMYQLAAALYRDARKEMAPQVPQTLMRAALHGDPLPKSLLTLAVARNRAEQRVTHNRAALIKAVFVTNTPKDSREEISSRMTALDKDNVEPAYICGRLLAELEAVQLAAQGKTNTTIVSRFYGAASSAPGTVFGQLLTMAQKAHLSKLRKTKPGLAYTFEQRIEEIMHSLQPGTAFPRTLTLSDQALFSLGFYHQRAFDRKAIADAKRAREEGRANSTDLALAEIEAVTDINTSDDTDQEEL